MKTLLSCNTLRNKLLYPQRFLIHIAINYPVIFSTNITRGIFNSTALQLHCSRCDFNVRNFQDKPVTKVVRQHALQKVVSLFNQRAGISTLITFDINRINVQLFRDIINANICTLSFFLFQIFPLCVHL